MMLTKPAFLPIIVNRWLGSNNPEGDLRDWWPLSTLPDLWEKGFGQTNTTAGEKDPNPWLGGRTSLCLDVKFCPAYLNRPVSVRPDSFLFATGIE